MWMPLSSELCGDVGRSETKMLSRFSLVLILIVFICAKMSLAGRMPPPRYVENNELLMTREEKDALEKVVSAISPHMTKGWLKSLLKNQIAILRWLRARNLDVEGTIDNAIKLVKLSRDLKLDTILEEDWSDMTEEFPYHTSAVDRQGRPVFYIDLGEGWNIRRAILQGKRERIKRYLYRITYEMVTKTLELNKRKPNITQVVMLMNLDGFNPMEHTCVGCVQTYLTIIEMFEQFLPGFANEIVLVNAVPAMHLLYQMVRPVTSPSTRKIIKIFDTNRGKWKAYLDNRIDPSQLPREFGGTKRRT